MKKTYQRPDIYFDSFQLSTNIAACMVHNYTQSNGECGYEVGSRIVFTTEVAGCKWKAQDGSVNDGLCYHVPTAANNLFNS